MSMKERLLIHKRIEESNRSKYRLWHRFEEAKRYLGFYPSTEADLIMFEHNGYDDGIFMYR